MNASASVRIAFAAGTIVLSGCGGTPLPASSLAPAHSAASRARAAWQLFADVDYPQGIVLAKNGDMWVGNGSHSSTLTRYTPTGKSRMFEVGLPPGELTFDRKGNIWFNVAGGVETQIVRVTPQMRVTQYPISDNAYSGITLGADGNVWFVEANHIGKITPAGKLTEYPSPETGGYTGIIWGTDNRVWFGTSQSLASLDPKNGKITRILRRTATAAVTSFRPQTECYGTWTTDNSCSTTRRRTRRQPIPGRAAWIRTARPAT